MIVTRYSVAFEIILGEGINGLTTDTTQSRALRANTRDVAPGLISSFTNCIF